MFRSFHMSGIIPDCNNALYILDNSFAKISAVSFNAFGCIPSGPGDLFGFISSSNLWTSFSSIWCSAHLTFISLGSRLGISPSGSMVKTLLKNSANTSAFSPSFSVVFIHEWGKDRIVITTNGTYHWPICGTAGYSVTVNQINLTTRNPSFISNSLSRKSWNVFCH